MISDYRTDHGVSYQSNLTYVHHPNQERVESVLSRAEYKLVEDDLVEVESKGLLRGISLQRRGRQYIRANCTWHPVGIEISTNVRLVSIQLVEQKRNRTVFDE